jgi:hypothetical protein
MCQVNGATTQSARTGNHKTNKIEETADNSNDTTYRLCITNEGQLWKQLCNLAVTLGLLILPNILWVPTSKVLYKLNPKTATGGMYAISENEPNCTVEKLEVRLCRL